MRWEIIHPRATREHLGMIPDFILDADPTPAVQQLDRMYQHGGGWQPFAGFTQLPNGDLSYPGDELMVVLAQASRANGEVIRIHDCAWVSVTQPDGSFEVARMD